MFAARPEKPAKKKPKVPMISARNLLARGAFMAVSDEG
jgi:hypothetical protein